MLVEVWRCESQHCKLLINSASVHFRMIWRLSSLFFLYSFSVQILLCIKAVPAHSSGDRALSPDLWNKLTCFLSIGLKNVFSNTHVQVCLFLYILCCSASMLVSPLDHHIYINLANMHKFRSLDFRACHVTLNRSRMSYGWISHRDLKAMSHKGVCLTLILSWVSVFLGRMRSCVFKLFLLVIISV